MRTKTRTKTRLLILIAATFPLLQNCGFKVAPISDPGSKTASNFPPIGSPGTTPTPTPTPAPVDCSGASETDQYNTSVTNYQVSQDEIAMACVDTALDYSGNISFPETDIFKTVRFQTTCASRWCDSYLKETAGVGVVTSPMTWTGNSLDIAATVSVQCRSSKQELVVDPCSQMPVIRKPLENFAVAYDDVRCNYCGCDEASVGSRWGIGKQSLIECGTNFCKAENAGFHWGLLSEVSSSGFLIRCSRATLK